VPSERLPGVIYDVWVDEDGQWVCAPCPDWASTHKPCKHVFEVLYRFFPALAPRAPDTDPFTKRGWYEGARQFPQEPFPYTEGLAESTRRDHALETQDERVESLLVDLAVVLNGRHPRLPDAWRPNLPAGDKVLISVLRAQHTKSIRKFRPILKRLAAECKIAFAPCKTTIIAYNKTTALTALLWEAFRIVTDPYRLLERDVIIDSTGFSPFYVSNWRDRRADENEGRPPTDYRSGTEWFKVHAIIGRISKVILGWAMTPYRGEGVGDPSLLKPLLLDIKGREFEPHFLIGDNAYLTAETYQAALDEGVQLVAPLKPKNFDRQGLPRGIAQRVHAFASRNPDLYDELTRARQAIEGIFSTEKKEDNHVASIGTQDERDAHAAVLQAAGEVAADETRDDEEREAEVKRLEDEAAAMGLYTARINEMLARAIRQVLRQTVHMELRWNRRISYTKGSVFGPVRETLEPGK
jgi:Transposase DDE domain